MVKIAISVPDEVLQDIERERLAVGETRSEFFRRAIKVYFQSKRKKEDVEQYVRGYQELPETKEELGWVEAASQAVLAEYPWEDEAKQ